MLGDESALAVVQASMVHTALRGWHVVARVHSGGPAEIGRLAGYDAPFEVGSPAHLTLVDPAATRLFDTAALRGKGVNSPYLGRTLPGRVVATIHGGVPTVLNGELRSPEEVSHG
jgi:dihydroorotase